MVGNAVPGAVNADESNSSAAAPTEQGLVRVGGSRQGSTSRDPFADRIGPAVQNVR
jgi:hypothetical protein